MSVSNRDPAKIIIRNPNLVFSRVLYLSCFSLSLTFILPQIELYAYFRKASAQLSSLLFLVGDPLLPGRALVVLVVVGAEDEVAVQEAEGHGVLLLVAVLPGDVPLSHAHVGGQLDRTAAEAEEEGQDEGPPRLACRGTRISFVRR